MPASESDPRIQRIRAKLLANRKLNEDDHVDMLRVYLENNPDPQFQKEVRENIRNAGYLSRMRSKINVNRVRAGLPLIAERDFQRLVYVMGGLG